jgi:glutamate dehydrogenase
MIHELTQQQTRSIEKVVPWFLNTMPAPYFRQVPESFRLDHIKAISAIKDANMDMHMNLKTHLPDGRQVLTFIRPGTMPGLLLNMIKELPFNQRSEEYMPLSRVQIYSAEDDSMSLNLFVYGEENKQLSQADVTMTGSHILEFAQQLMDGTLPPTDEYGRPNPMPNDSFSRDRLIEHMERCSESYIVRSDPRRFLSQFELFQKVSGSDNISVSIEDSFLDENNEKHYWVDIALANALPHFALEQAAQLLFLHSFDVLRAHLDNVNDGDNGTVTLLRMLVTPVDGARGDEATFNLLKQELKRSKWLSPATMDLVYTKQPWLGVRRGEIITAMCTLMHPILSKQNAIAFSKGNILETVTKDRYVNHAAAIADLFLERFNPKEPLTDQELEEQSNELRAIIDNEVEDTPAQEMLLKMIDIIKHTLKTNIYMNNRYALGLRLDPKIMVAEGETPRETPYGVIFVHGRRVDGYHVRFRDIARGGMRLVTPASPEQFALESAHQYDEVYGLAYAQQLKNKDIPEGGSKAVVLVDTVGMSPTGKDFVMRKSVKAFTDTILDLVVDTEETNEEIVNFLGKKEVLYLGPDEQVIPEDIDWIIKRAAQRGYDTPAAFMSSKPRAGINHKEYGVTSEGVNVYLDVALRHVLKINPKQESFTVKITGGPDGDVAGNELKILNREYGDNAKVVGIADGTGCAEDPNGLNWEELLHLVHNNLPIDHFDPSKLGEGGALHRVDTEEGVKARNSMHNRVQADAFIPGGGRPNTINVHNYQHFLNTDGTPSAPLIVEGANLFVTDEARQLLFDEAGVIIVKDSSANKAGVITSSYEICAAMMLSEDEFYQNKPQIVGEVLDKLHEYARMEAELLFREFENYGGNLPQLSKVVSGSVNAATDALTVALETFSEEDKEKLLPLFRAHLPKTMADLAFDRVRERVPAQYITNAVASCLASKLVYKEGTKFVETLPEEKLADVALRYLEAEHQIALLKDSLENTDMPEKEKESILKLLDAGGARTALGVF